MSDVGAPVAMFTVHAGDAGITLLGPGVQLSAATLPGALRHLASTIDGRPLNPAIVGGVYLHDLPDGVVPLATVMSIKALNPDGRPTYYERWSPDLHSVEALGMATTLADSLRARLIGLHT